ncbi:hypothetical protein EXIGLDRAFT_779272 [Exidia glandulosa HHB12029]|uniref:Uncharacterized protein n=1 Tax=Exidia glandulosa HHB12029 TaxID=1314781 RepID=A0A165C4Z2_EXIGL|nr:hypothetical protein EXIGLDRAFT_779272 [Exidia glandulosa HHB12029]
MYGVRCRIQSVLGDALTVIGKALSGLKTFTITAQTSDALETEGDLLPAHKVPQTVRDGERPTVTIREVEAFLSRHRMKKKSQLEVIMNGVDFAERRRR